MNEVKQDNADAQEEMRQYFSSFFSRFPNFSLDKISQLARKSKDSNEKIEYPNYSPPSVENFQTSIISANNKINSFNDSAQAVERPVYHDENF
ncbi:hypothetical protein GYT97_07630 [Lactobacillus mellis]|uniref:hypothetical protein n=1 Tax=Bombilactobacillus mellis TaxID=1218508 RepID=UPI001580725C|nr:hypothetical protein [Bombilactobacillus mellis]NUG39751.1 hypothetical protein [Bombilactobacillus mellis]